MKNYVQKGETITVTATGTVAAGDVIVLGGLTGIAANDAVSGRLLDVALSGVYRISKVASDAFTVGQPVHRSATGLGTATVGSNALIGHAIEPVAAGGATVLVRLRG